MPMPLISPLLSGLVAACFAPLGDPLDAPRFLRLGMQAVGVADLDQDGDLDVVLRRASPGLPAIDALIMLNSGAGQFSEGALLLTDPGLGALTTPLLADLDGDGLADLVQAYSEQSTGSQGLQVRAGLGTGSFGPAQRASFSPAHFQVPSAVPTEATAADFDGDGRAEVAMVYSLFDGTGDDRQQLIVWERQAGLLVPSPGIEWPFINGAMAVDVDSDGAYEIATQFPPLWVLEWTAGSAPTPLAPSSAPPFLYGARRIDWEGDGDVDFLSAYLGVWTVLLNRLDEPSADWSSVTLPPPAQIGGLGEELEIGESAADHDGDGYPELLVSGEYFGANSSIVAIEWNPLAGAWSQVWSRKRPTLISVESADLSAFELPLGHYDLDGDGQLERFLSPQNFYTEEPVGLQPNTQLLVPGPSGAGLFNGGLFAIGGLSATVRDFDFDGDPDLAFDPSPFNQLEQLYLANNGAGQFSYQTYNYPSPPAGQTFHSPILGVEDFNGDGHLDLLTAVYSVSPPVLTGAYVLHGLPSGAFVAPGASGLTVAMINELDALRCLARPHGDLDGDGRTDLITPAWVLRSQASGAFEVLLDHALSSVLEVVDLDGDGRDEVLRLEGTDLVALHFNFDFGVAGAPFTGYTSEVLYQFPAASIGLDEALVAADLNGDGDFELVVLGHLGLGGPLDFPAPDLWVLEQSAGGPWLGQAMGQSSPGALRAAEFNGLPGMEVIVASPNGVLLVSRLPGGGFEALGYQSDFPMQVADLDGDGDAELLCSGDVFDGGTFAGPTAGARLQYGQGSPGSWSAVPVLGAVGPLRPDSTSAELRLSRALGGATCLLGIGLDPLDLPWLPGVSLHMLPAFPLLSLSLAGSAAAPGEGLLEFSLVPLLANLSGLSLALQALVLDPGSPHGFSTTNGLLLQFGA